MRNDMRASKKTGGRFCQGATTIGTPFMRRMSTQQSGKTCCVNPTRQQIVCPETRQVIGEGRRRPELAVIGNCDALFLIAIHRCAEIAASIYGFVATRNLFHVPWRWKRVSANVYHKPAADGWLASRLDKLWP